MVRRQSKSQDSALRFLNDEINALLKDVQRLESDRLSFNQKIDREVGKLESNISFLRELIAKRSRVDPDEGLYLTTPLERADNQSLVNPLPQKQRKITVRERVIILARKVLEEDEGPLNRAEIYRKFLEMGYEIPVNNPRHFIGKALGGNPEFVNSGYGYTLRKGPSKT